MSVQPPGLLIDRIKGEPTFKCESCGYVFTADATGLVAKLLVGDEAFVMCTSCALAGPQGVLEVLRKRAPKGSSNFRELFHALKQVDAAKWERAVSDWRVARLKAEIEARQPSKNVCFNIPRP